MSTWKKFDATRRELCGALIERDTEVDLCLTALVAREHVLLVGDPGTAKSLLADALVSWSSGERFRILLTKFTTPEEVCGPVSLAGLKSDRYRRIIDGKLPTAHVAFLDEIFKASSAILNTMLTLLNERSYDNDGERVRCPLLLAIGASNEWPGHNGDGLELGALFDRFLFRRHVRPVATDRGLNRLAFDDISIELSTTITPEEIESAADAAADLEFSGDAREAFLLILREARNEGIAPGDRRIRKATGACKAYAWLNGHSRVEKDDLEILAHVLWADPAEQPAKLAKIVGKLANPAAMRVNGLLAEAEQIIAATSLSDLGQCAVAVRKLSEVRNKLADLSGAKATAAAEHVAAEIKRIRLATVEAL